MLTSAITSADGLDLPTIYEQQDCLLNFMWRHIMCDTLLLECRSILLLLRFQHGYPQGRGRAKTKFLLANRRHHNWNLLIKVLPSELQ